MNRQCITLLNLHITLRLLLRHECIGITLEVSRLLAKVTNFGTFTSGILTFASALRLATFDFPWSLVSFAFTLGTFTRPLPLSVYAAFLHP